MYYLFSKKFEKKKRKKNCDRPVKHPPPSVNCFDCYTKLQGIVYNTIYIYMCVYYLFYIGINK